MKRIIDLTYKIQNGMRVFPGKIPPVMVHNDQRPGGGSLFQRITLDNHLGTHIDTSSHFINNGETIDKVQPSRLMGKAVILNLTEKQNGDVIHQKDLEGFWPAISRNKRIILYTGWEAKTSGKSFFKDYPILTEAAAMYLADLNIELLGLDTPSPDPVGSSGNKIHRILMEKNILIVESLANLASITESSFEIIVLPLLLEGCSGSPCRVVAVIEGETDSP